jgi:hypothetical protein
MVPVFPLLFAAYLPGRIQTSIEYSVPTAVAKDDTGLFKRFMDNDGIRRWMPDTIFGFGYEERA